MIISASRRTDIPAFYSEWFLNRIKEGFLYVRNPMNSDMVSKIDLSPDKIDCIVFWTKDPSAILDKLIMLEDYNFYFQFTLNSYGKDIEKNVPLKSNLIQTFKKLSGKIGKERIVWRYDPIFYTKTIDFNYHVKYFEYLCKNLQNHTDTCVISFLEVYRKIRKKVVEMNIISITEDEILRLSGKLLQISKKYNIKLTSCCEKHDLSSIGIKKGSCIDSELIEKISGKKINVKKDNNQRKGCRCVESIDIGAYNTCIHNCIYCYANMNNKLTLENYKKHKYLNSILGKELSGNEKVFEKKIKSCFQNNLNLF